MSEWEPEMYLFQPHVVQEKIYQVSKSKKGLEYE